MKKIFIILFGISIIFGCSSVYDIESIENKENYGNDFDKIMQKGYIKLAKNAEYKHDWDGVEAFVRRAKWSSDGESPDIPPFNEEKINKNHRSLIKSSYQRINRAFSFGAKIKNKINAATAQISYECMVYFAKDDEITFEMSECRKNFEIAMRPFEVRDQNNNEIISEQENFFLKEDVVTLPDAEGTDKNILELLEERMQSNKPVILPKEVSETIFMNKSIEISRKSFIVKDNDDFAFTGGKYIIYFKFNSSKIGKNVSPFIQKIAEDYKENSPEAVNINGYTDTVGSKKINLIISKRRAKVVANALKKQGVPENKMVVKGMGKTMLAVPTLDQVKERKNRRTEVSFR